MRFDDRDLAHLKSELFDDTLAVSYGKPILQALLARLEAAELVCDSVEQWADIYTPRTTLAYIEAWRKAAGK